LEYHGDVIRRSGDNLSRFIEHVTQSGVFIWFSGGTVDADHGSVMVYSIWADTQNGWNASFRRTDDWRLYRVQGLSRPELASLIERGVDAHAA
jgi:hypothetical protein